MPHTHTLLCYYSFNTFVDIFGNTENFHFSNSSVEIFGKSEYFHSTTNHYICGNFRKNRKFPLFQCICGNFREIRIFPLHHKLVQIGNLSETISDSGVCMILYAAKLAELSYQGGSVSSLNNLVLYLGQNNQDSLILKQMRSEITHLMHELSWKYSSVCVHDSQKNYPGLFHLSKDESSECGDSTKQVSVSTDDSATSIWRPN